jgi:D-alanyl-D-alanine carboxypeptidase (penicillin-binding protein 5/6)
MNSPLQGGRRRRHRDGPLAALVTLLALAAVGAVVFSVLSGEDPRQTRVPVAASGARLPGHGTAGPGVARHPAIQLGGVDAFSIRFKRPPRAGLVFDVETGDVLWRRRALRRLPMASLTKIMTAILVVERKRPRDRVRVPRRAIRYPGSGLGVLKRRRLVPVEGLLYGLMLASGNDAAITLAHGVAGSERRFVRVMTRRARRQGLSCTRYVSPHGLQSGNVSCAADLAALARLAMRSSRIRRIVRRAHAAVRFPIKGGRLYVTTHNPLLLQGYRGTIGLKTGFTNEAGRCFVAVVRRGGRTLGVVLLHSPDPARQAKRLLGTAFRLG